MNVYAQTQVVIRLRGTIKDLYSTIMHDPEGEYAEICPKVRRHNARPGRGVHHAF